MNNLIATETLKRVCGNIIPLWLQQTVNGKRSIGERIILTNTIITNNQVPCPTDIKN